LSTTESVIVTERIKKDIEIAEEKTKYLTDAFHNVEKMYDHIEAMIKDEMTKGEGKTVKAIKEKIQRETVYMKQRIEDNASNIKADADRFEKAINNMHEQKMTIHYESKSIFASD